MTGPGIPPAPDRAAITVEMDHLLYVLNDLQMVWYHYPMNMLVPLHQRYSARYAELYGALVAVDGVAVGMVPPAPPAAAAAAVASPPSSAVPPPPSSPAAPVPARAAPREPWFREFVTDHAILLLAYLGALALIVATVLFLVYTTGEIAGGVRFSVVLGVTLMFGAGGMVCLDKPRLQIVGRSYLLVFALMAPLTAAAAYRFLTLSAHGIEPHSAVAVGAGYSAVLYALMARRVGSLGYALLALLCVPLAGTAALAGVVSTAELGGVVGAFAAVLVAVEFAAPMAPSFALFEVPGRIGGRIVMTMALLLAAITLPRQVDYETLSLTTVEVFTALAVAASMSERRVELWLTEGVALLGVASLAITFHATPAMAAAGYLGLAAINAAFAIPLTRRDKAVALVSAAITASTAALQPLTSGEQITFAAAVVLLGAAFAHMRRDARILIAPAAAVVIQMIANPMVVDLTVNPRLVYLPVAAWMSALALASLLVRDIKTTTIAAALSAAATAVLLTTYSVHATSLQWAAALTMLGCAAVALTAFTPATWRPTAISVSCVFLIAAATQPMAGLSQGIVMATIVIALAAQAHVSRLGVVMGAAAVALLLQVAAADVVTAVETPPRVLWLTICAWLMAGSMASLVVRDRRSDSALATVVTVLLAAVLTCYTGAADATVYCVVLVAAAATSAGVGHLLRHIKGMGDALAAASVFIVVVAMTVIATPAWFEALLMAVATMTVVGASVSRGRPDGLLLAGAPLASFWYWAGSAVVTTPSTSASTLAKLYLPLAIILGITAITMRLGSPTVARRWAPPVEIIAALVAAFATLVAFGAQDATLTGLALLAVTVVVYVDGRVTGDVRAIVVSTVSLTLAVLEMLNGGAAPAAWYPLAAGGAGLLVFCVGVAHGRASIWSAVHRTAGLAILTAVAVSAVAVPEFHQQGDVGALTAFIEILCLCGALAAEATLLPRPSMEYMAMAVAAAATMWIAVYYGAVNPQAYVAIPAAATVLLGLTARDDSRITIAADTARMIIGGGACLFLGISALQGLGEGSDTSLYIALLFGESLGCVLLAIARRDRSLFTVAGAGVIVAALEALGNIIQAIPLYYVFAAAAVILLGLATTLAATRQQASQARAQVSGAWRTWR